MPHFILSAHSLDLPNCSKHHFYGYDWHMYVLSPNHVSKHETHISTGYLRIPPLNMSKIEYIFLAFLALRSWSSFCIPLSMWKGSVILLLKVDMDIILESSNMQMTKQIRQSLVSNELICWRCLYTYCFSLVQVSVTKYHRVGSLLITNSLFTDLRSWLQHGQRAFWIVDFLYSHKLEGSRDPQEAFLIWAVIPFMRSGPSQLKHLPKVPSTSCLCSYRFG